MATILVVDDYAVSLRLMSHILNRADHDVLTADHGLNALDLLEQYQIDLVILDIDMPEINGIAVLKRIRADARFATLPVIMLTASGDDRDRVDAIDAGADGFLTKPASSDEIVDAVNRLLDN
ncbi:MAG: response regulator [Aggregatilineales bacterium]